MRITIGKSAILTILVFALGCSQEKIEEREPLKIALNVWPGYACAFLAEKKGYFEKNGVDVRLMLRKEYSQAQELYIDGEADGIFEVYTDSLFHNSEGISTKVVYVMDYSDTGDVIVGKAEFDSLLDLAGKRIGIEGINSFSHLFVLTVLEKAGLSELDVEFENVPAHNVLTALEKGIIDAGHTWEPTKSDALKKGYKIIARAGEVPGIITDVLAFNSRITQERPQAVLAVIKSLVQAQDYLRTNRSECLRIMAEAEGMGEQEMGQGVNGVYLQDLDGNIEAFAKSERTTSLYGSGRIIARFYLNRGQLSQMPDFNEIIEPRFIHDLSSE